MMHCDLCEDNEIANWFCKDCDQSLCDKCKRSHLRINVSKSHNVLLIDEGFEMGKRNISILCLERYKLFAFFCRTCQVNICSKCLSMKHKIHDFVGIHELQLEVKKQLEDIIKEKKIEKQIMENNYHDSVQHKGESEIYLKEQYSIIDDRINAIKMTADEEGEKLKKSISSEVNQQEEEAEKGKHKLQTQTVLYDGVIQTVQQELRLQTASTLNVFVKESITKLKALKPTSITIPEMKYHFSKETVDRNEIREMVGRLQEKPIIDVDNVDVKSTTDLKTLGSLFSMCLSPGGSIWIGGSGVACKMSSDCSSTLRQIPARGSYSCGYIACLQSGDAVVSYGSTKYIDRFTSDGRRIEFSSLSPGVSYDIAVNSDDQVVIKMNKTTIVTLSNEGKRLREYKLDDGIRAFSTDGNIIFARKGSGFLEILDGRSGKHIGHLHVTLSDIECLTHDSYGYLLSTNGQRNIYIGYKNRCRSTCTIKCDDIIRIFVNKDDKFVDSYTY
ncbi:hypothetical protein FSP39_002291 [Pinctada imbricata]|uniref:B box-type domain-containing protein n=1 Tax=Pinctada imbricata TaxID=66713 RepID=A0AA88YNV5_PINIB|nr:hypothetical protein FSP39_002291 [Pinctada imbricata]